MSARAVSPPHPEIVSEGLRPRRAGWIQRATDADHKSVARLYLAGSMAFLVVAALEFALLRLQLIVPENTAIQPENFEKLLSTFGPTVVVLFVIPLALGLVGYIVPLQLGARGVALPRVGLLSAWLYLLGGAVVYGSFLYRPSTAGIAALPPLSNTTFAPTHGVDTWIVGVGLAVLGFVCFAVNLLTTVRTMRAPGMAWRRAPLFSWAGTAISWVVLVTGPAMLAGLVMLMIDRHFSGHFFWAPEGGAPLLYEHLAWIFYTGAYVIVVLMAAGAISEILPTFARKPIFSHRAAATCIAAIAPLGVLAWMQNMYTAPIPKGFLFFAMLMALALTVPVGLLVINWIATLSRGALRLTATSLFALGALSTLVFGLAGELGYSVIPVGWQLANTTAAQGDTAYVIVGGGVMGGFAALHYWFPKICGRTMNEGLGRASFWTILIGIHLYVLPMFLAGLKGQPADVQKFYEGLGLDGFNLIASIGSFILLAGILLGAANAAWSYLRGNAAGHDPWGGATLEWFALSPPPPHNFDAVPDVRSPEPLLDIREAIRERDELWPPSSAPRQPEPEGEPVAAVAAEGAPEEPSTPPEPEGDGGEGSAVS